MQNPTDNSMQDLKPTVWIGKQGCTGTMIEEIASQLKKRKLIKVKWLQNAEVDPEDVAARAKARLVEVRGRTMVLADKGKNAPARSPHDAAAAAGLKPASRKPGKARAGTDTAAKAARSRLTGAMQPAKKRGSGR